MKQKVSSAITLGLTIIIAVCVGASLIAFTIKIIQWMF